jgi:hypothetical protein
MVYAEAIHTGKGMNASYVADQCQHSVAGHGQVMPWNKQRLCTLARG